MTVAFLGNMNNNHFAMVRYLRDRGLDARLLLFDGEPDHFHPSADAYDESYRSYCQTLSWGNPVHWSRTPGATIAKDLAGYDVIVGCGFAPAYGLRAGRLIDVFAPFGADLHRSTRYWPTYPRRLYGTWQAVRYQRRAIPKCSVFHMELTNALYERRWAQYRGAAQRWYFGLPMVYTGMYTPEAVASHAGGTRWAREFRRIRERSDLLLLSHVRHVWGGRHGDPNQKGTDRLFRGVALLKRRHPGLKVNLITFEYGTRVSQSKSLVAKLGLDDSIHWFPISLRKDLMCGVLHADVVCSEFEHSWLSSGVVYEGLAMGKPVLGFRSDELYRERYPRLYPMMNARNAESICARLEEWLADPVRHREMGEEGRRWYAEMVVSPAIRQYVSFVESRGAGAAVAAQ